MKSFMQLNENIKFEKNIDIFVEGLVVSYPKLTNEKINYIIRNVGGVNGKAELIEQLISNLNKVAPGSVFNEYMIEPSAAPQASTAPAQKPAAPVKNFGGLKPDPNAPAPAQKPVQKQKYTPPPSTPEELKTATSYIKHNFKNKLEQLARQDVQDFYRMDPKAGQAYHNLMLQLFAGLNDVMKRLKSPAPAQQAAAQQPASAPNPAYVKEPNPLKDPMGSLKGPSAGPSKRNTYGGLV